MHLRTSIFGVAAIAFSSLLSGCGIGSGNGTGSNNVAGAAVHHITGRIMGGQQPVTSSTIQMYTVGTTGTGSAATSILTGSVTSDGSGNFSLTGLYSCTNATQIYITATGGNSGAGTNSSIALMAALGSCQNFLANEATEYVTINELTTVAAVYSLAPFMTNITHIGATGSNPTGLLNAFAQASALVNWSTGLVTTAPTGVTLPTATIDTIADILAACINTASSTSTACNMLYAAAGATNVVDAGLAIAHAPGATAITALYPLASGYTQFLPTLSTQPKDFSLAINYTSAALQVPYGVAIDASGNAWVTNEAGSSVVKFASAASGALPQLYAVGGLLSPRGISIDRSGNIWIANTGGNNVVELSSAGAVLSGAGYAAGSAPVAIANDSAGNAWVANFNSNTVTELSSSGGLAASLATSISLPTSVAIDASGRVAVANAGTGAVCLFSNAGVFASCPTDGTLFGATSIAVSPTGTLAMAGSTTGSSIAGAFTLGTSAGAINTASPVAGGGLTLPTAVAYDGSGTAWFANTASISAFNGATAITPTTGYGTLSAPQGIAVDPSGNVWTTNSGDNSVSVFVGLASPTSTPLAANVGP